MGAPVIIRNLIDRLRGLPPESTIRAEGPAESIARVPLEAPRSTIVIGRHGEPIDVTTMDYCVMSTSAESAEEYIARTHRRAAKHAEVWR